MLEETSHILDPINLHLSPRDIAAYGDSAWITACGTPGTVARVNEQGDVTVIAAGGAVCEYVGVRGNPIRIAAGQEGVWVTDGGNGTLSRIREATNQVDAPGRVGDTPTAVAVGLGAVWVAVDGEESPSPSTS